MNTLRLRSAAAALGAALVLLVPAGARAAPTAQCGLSLPAGPLLGEDLSGQVTFTPTPNDPIGFQPAIELVLPPEVGYRAGSATYDVGGPMTVAAAITVPASGVIVNPYTGQGEDLIAAGLARPGDTYLLLRYPLSNLAWSAPAAHATLTLQQTAAAAVDVPFTVQARCLYLLGATAVNDVATDPPLATATVTSASVTPQLVRVETYASNGRTGSHVVTGPTSPIGFTVRVYVARNQTVQDLTVVQDVSTKLQLTGIPAAPGANAISPGTPPLGQGGQVSATWTSLTGLGTGPAATVTFIGYVEESDNADLGSPVLPAAGRIGASIPSQARITTYTVGGVVLATPLLSNVASIVPHGAMVMETISPDPSIPGQSITVREEMLVSDYLTFAPRGAQGTNTLHVELTSGIHYDGATGAVTLPLTCDAGAAVASAGVPATVTPPAAAADPITLDLVLPDLPGASPGGGSATTACHVSLGSTILPTYGAGGPPVFSSDVLPTHVRLGTVVDDGGAGLAASQTEGDSGHDDSVHIRSFTMAKTLVGSPEYVNPGDAVTWRITGDVMGGATDTSTITDFMPAPIFDVTELGPGGPGGPVGAVGSGLPVAFDPITSPFLQTLGITYTTDAQTNSITFAIPGFPFQGAAQQVGFLIGLTIQHRPADDRLVYVNLTAGTQQGTLTYRTSAAAAAMFAVNEPKLVVHHGITGALAAVAPVFTPGVPAYAAQAPGAANVWSSSALADPPASSVSDVDAGDGLVFAAVLENVGNAPAYDVTADVAVPGAYGSPSVISITDGAGNPIPGATAVSAGGTITLGIPALPAVSAGAGQNVVVLRYGVPLSVAVQAQEVLDPSVLSLTGYTSVDLAGAPTFVGTPLTASAGASIHDLALSRSTAWSSPAYPDADRAAGQAAVGDVGRYTIDVTIPEGTQRALTLSDLLPTGLALVPGSLGIAAGSDFTGGDFTGGSPASSGPGGFTWTLGTVVNGRTDGVPRVLRIQYDALLQNLASVTATTPPGTATATLALGAPPSASSPLPTALTATAAPPAVVEPALTLSDLIAPAMPVPGGTTLTVQVIVAHAAGSTAPARDVAYSLTLPAGSLSAPFAAAFTQNPAGCAAPSVSGQTISFTCSRIPLGQQEVLSFQINVPASSTIASQFALSAVASPPVLTWTSVPAATLVSGSFVARTGLTSDPGGVANTYAAQDGTQIRVTPTAATKTLVGATTRTIGDWVDWDASMVFPVGTTTTSMVDALPSGLAFVAGSETSTFLNPDPATLTWTNGGGNALPSPALSGSNRTATWNLGTITRLVGGSGALSFRVRARVQDIPVVVVSGATLAANSLTPPGGSALVADHAITIVEPALQITTTPTTPQTADAGNTITWTTTISHTAGSTAPAHDVALHYLLAGKLAPGAGNVAGCAGGVNPAVTLGTAGANTTADLTLDALPLGTTCVLTWTTQVAATVLAGEALTQPAGQTFRWRSLPDATAAGAERTYTTTPAALPTVQVPGFTRAKSRLSGATAEVGELVSYRITVNVPESAATALTVADTLPRGMEYVSATLDFSAGNLVCTPNPCTGIAPTLSGTLSGTTNRIATWDFGSIANTTNGATTATRAFNIDVTARIADIAANGTTLSSYTNQARLNGGTQASAPAVALVQPTAAITLTPSVTTADAGDTVTWTARISAGTATAYDMLAHYVLPAHLTPGITAVGTCTGGTTPVANVTSAGGNTVIDLSLASLTAGSSCTITFTTPLDPAVQAGETLGPLAGQSLRWRSQPDATAGGTERTYTSTPSAPATVQVPGLTIAKTRTSAATTEIAQAVTYRVAVTVPESGGTPLIVIDTLPPGMEYVSAALDFSAGNLTCTIGSCTAVTASVTGTLGAGTNRVATWDFGSVANTTGTAGLGTRTFNIDVTARVADIPANGTTITSWTNLARVNAGAPASAVAVTLMQPSVAITLTPSTATADAGDTVTWTAVITASTATAYDVLAHYVLPAHLTPGTTAVGTCTGGTSPVATITSSGGNTVADLSLASLAAGSSCTMTFTTPIDPAVQAGETLAPVAGQTLRWRSQPDAAAGGTERTYTSTPTAPATIQVPGFVVRKTRTSAATTEIAQMVTYRIAVDVPESSNTPLVVTDTLPPGMEYVNATLDFSAGNLTCTAGSCSGITAGVTGTLGAGTSRVATWDFGSVANTTAAATLGVRTFSIDVTARIADIPANGTTITSWTNQARVNSGAPVSATAVTLVQPSASITLTPSTTTADAGDTITWTAVIAASAATAHDVLAHYVLPAHLTPGTGAVGTCTGGTTPLASIASSGVNTVADLSLASLTAGSSCTLTFTTPLDPAVQASEILAPLAGQTLRWRSQPDATAGGTERTYTSTPAAPSTIQVPGFVVRKTRTSAATTEIAQAVTYRIAVDVPESGSTPLVVTDTLPPGMEYVSAALDFSAGNLTCTAGSCSAVTPIVTGTLGAGTSRVATWDFGSVANTTAAATLGIRTFNIDVTARIADIAPNGTTITSWTNQARVNSGTPASAAAVTLVQPSASVTLTPSTTTADGGDTITWTAVFTITATATAHDLLAHYVLPAHLTPGTGAVGTCTGGTTPVASIASSGGNTVADLSLASLTAGSSCTLTFTTPLDPAVQAGETLAPVAGLSLRWRSQPDATAGGTERTYTSTPAAPATIQVPSLTATKTRTSAATTEIAQEVTYRIAVTVPENGGTPLVVTDTLPPGMEYVSAALDFSAGNLTCTVGSCTAVTPSVTGTLGAGANRVATWDFGAVANTTGTVGLGTKTFNIDVTTRIADIAANGTTLNSWTNQARVNAGAPVSALAVTLVQPSLSIALTPSITTADAGDTITWTGVFTATATATAHDVLAHYVFPGHLDPGNQTSNTCAGGVTVLTASGGNTLVDLSATSLAAGASCTVVFTTPLDPAVQASETLAPSGGQSLRWRSQPDATAGGAERTYTSTPAAPATVRVPALTVAKARTSPPDTGVSVGEGVVYRVSIGLPEGQTTGVQLVDTLPAGLRFASARFVNPGGDLACTPACADGAAASAVVAGQQATFALGQVTPASSAATPRMHTLAVDVTAVVDAVAGNVGGTVIGANSAQAQSTFSGPTSASSADSLSVEEPALAITSIANDASAPDAGNTVTYTATLTTPPGATHLAPLAYDVALHAILPGKLAPGSIDLSGCPSATSTPANQIIAGAGSDTVVDVVLDTLILPASSCAVRFRVILGPDVAAGETLALDTARSAFTYRSAPGGGRSYTAPVPASSFTTAPLQLSSALASAATAAVGSTVLYDLSVAVPEGETPISLVETLPAGLTFQSATVASESALGCAPTGCAVGTVLTPTTVAGQALTFDLGTVTNPGAGPTTARRTLTLRVAATVADVPGNAAGTTLAQNSVTTAGLNSTAASVQIIEPRLAAAASTSPTTVDARDPVTFTLTLTQPGSTADAYDVHLRYPLHTKLGAPTFDTSGCSGAVGLTTSGAGSAADVRMDRLPLGPNCVIAFTAAPTDAVEASETLAPPSAGALSWDSSPSASSTPRAYGATPAALASLHVPAIALSKARTSPDTQVSVGEAVVYRITVGVPEGTTSAVSLQDTLPAGLRFVSARFVNAGDVSCTPACADGAAATPALAGQTATFTLGSLATVSNAATARTRTLALDLSAIVDAVPGNVAGAVIGANAAQVQSTLSGPASASSGDSLTVDEPALYVSAITSDAAGPDAANTVTFTATLASPAAANLAPVAYAVSLHLTLPGKLRPGTIDLTGCPGAVSSAGAQSITQAGGLTVVDMVLDALPLPATSCALRFSTVLGPDVIAAETLAVDTALARSWLRFASAPASGVDYTQPVPGYGFAVAPLTFTSALASAARVPVGGLVQYDLTVHVPEGESPVALTELVPAGLTFRSATLSTAAGLSCAPAACADGASISPTAVSGQQVGFDLGTVTSSGAAATTVRRDLTVHVLAAVADAGGNQAGAALPQNSAAVNAGTPSLAAGVEVTEPALTASVSLSPAGAVDAGDDVAVSATVSNAWSAYGTDAWDVDVVLDLPPELVGRPGTITASAGCELSSSASAVTADALRFRLDHLAPGPVVGTSTDCTVTALLRPADAAVFGRTYSALGSSALTWASTAAPNADRRTGAGLDPLDDYRSALAFDVAMSTATGLAKAFVAGSTSAAETTDPGLAMGETAQYRVRVTLPEGTSPGVIVTDTPPPGLRIVSVAMDPDPLQGCTAPTCSFHDPTASVGGGSGEAHAFDLGTVVIPGTTETGGTLSLLVTVQAVPDAAQVALSANAVGLAVDGASTPSTATSPVLIVRGAPAVALDVSDRAPKGGDVVHVTATVVNRGTGPACDPHLGIALPAVLTVVPPGSPTLSLPAGTCLAPGAQRTLELDARVAADVPPDTVTVSATLGAYRSLAAGGVAYDPATDGFDSNGDGRADEAGDPTATVELLPVAPRLRFTKAAAVTGGAPLRPGGELAYTLRVENSGTLAARAVVITDALPLVNADAVPASATATQGAVGVSGGTLTARLGDVAPAVPAEVTVRLRVKDPVITADDLSNQATLATGDGYGGRPSDDPSTPAMDDPTVVPVSRNPACGSDSDCLLSQWCDLDAHACRVDLPHGAGPCTPGAPHAGAQCNCDPRLPASACLPPGVDACEPRDGVCGLVNGSPCEGLGAAVCRSLVCNADGRCGDPDGEGCDPDVQPNLTCRSGVCDPASRTCGLPPGEPCRTARECRSRSCGSDGRCGDLNATPCTDPITCRSGVCNADGHCGDPLGSACTTGTTCRSNTCEAGRCVEPCAADDGCAPGFFCEATAHLCRPAHTPGEACTAAHAGRDCTSGACGSDALCGLSDGEVCNAATACRGGGCTTGRCGACTADGDCAADRYCEPTEHNCAPRLPPAADCTPGAGGNRSCRSGLCAADGKCGTPDGLACASAADCRSGICTADGVCAAQGCSTDDDCLWNAYCDAGACAPRLHNGATCDRAAQCASAICDPDGQCGAPDRQPCDMLAPSPQCRSTACNPDDDACGFTGGQACTVPTECRVGICDDGDKQCGLPPGAACQGGDACRSQSCLNGVCTLCTTDEACGSDGFCDFPAGQCAPKRPPEDACDRGAQCTHGVCGDARTCLGGFQDGVGVSGSACNSAGETPLWLGLAGLLLLAFRRRRVGS